MLCKIGPRIFHSEGPPEESLQLNCCRISVPQDCSPDRFILANVLSRVHQKNDMVRTAMRAA